MDRKPQSVPRRRVIYGRELAVNASESAKHGPVKDDRCRGTAARSAGGRRLWAGGGDRRVRVGRAGRVAQRELGDPNGIRIN